MRWFASGAMMALYNEGMAPDHSSRRRQKSPPPGETGQEALYLRSLSERQVPVHVKLRDGETVSGWIEYFDDRMIRLTREGKPNLFIYKQHIRTITEHGRAGRRRVRKDAGGAEDAQ
ncbi:MAG: RNA chaperone Hfq [Acidobacteriaceae bacterium]